jgi:hypothetical protein
MNEKEYIYDNQKVSRLFWFDKLKNSSRGFYGNLKRKLNIIKEQGYYRAWQIKELEPSTHWPTYIKQAIKTGLESPTPYKVIPYKNGIGIKKIEFIK